MRKEIFNPDGCASLITAATASAQSDAQIKSELLGYWMSPRHGYLIQDNGLMRMCPTVGPNRALTTNRWDVRNGMFYQDGEPYKIVKLTKSEFDYEAVRGSGVEVDGKFLKANPRGARSRLRELRLFGLKETKFARITPILTGRRWKSNLHPSD